MIQEFLSYQEKNKGLSAETLRAYANDLRETARYLSARKQGASWSTTHRRDIDGYLASMFENGSKPATIRRRLATIRAFYNWLMTQGKMENNPARYCETPRRNRALPSTIDTAAIERYIADNTKPLTVRAMIALIYETGMRISEVASLDTRNVNPREKSIRVYEGKGMKTRKVYYGYWTQRLMNTYLQGRRGIVFQGMEDNQRAARKAIYQALNGNTIGERKASPHILRHTFATKMLNQGMSIASLSAILGHSHTNTTEIYAHVAQPTIRQEYERASRN